MEATNWAGNYAYRARTLHRPSTLEQVQQIVASARRVRVLGSRHSFTDIGDSEELLTLDGLPPDVALDHAARTVSFSAGVRYGELATILDRNGLALANLASLPHISVAGAVATASHGSGDHNGNLATAVAALEFVTSAGELRRLERGAPDFNGFVVGLGALGAVTRITLDVEPTYEISQRVFERLPWEALFGHFDEITSAGYSVSVFSRWGTDVDQVWVKHRVGDWSEAPPAELFGATPAATERHPIASLDPVNCTPQLGVAGRWSERLPHFRLGFTPSAGAEIQSEYHVPRVHAVRAIRSVRALAETIAPLLQVSEIRTVAADDLWMSPQYGTDTVAIHFTWRDDQPAVESALTGIEPAIAPFDARPHWGKLFLADADTLAGRYQRHGDFVELVARTDPRGTFRNGWLERHVLGGA
jgi:xylitol oxidase